jgi:hypothetical protein
MGSLLGTLLFAMQITLGWDAPSQGDPKSYIIYRDNGGGAIAIGQVDVPTQTYQDPAPMRGWNCYTVTAQTVTEESGPSNRVCMRCRRNRCP